MSENQNVTADVNADTSASGDVDAQLEQMQAEESQQETQETQETQESAEAKSEKEKPVSVVPLAALHEERNARKELQRQLAEQRQMMERVNQRLETLFTPQQQVPDKEAAPIDYIDHRLGEVSAQQRAILEREQQREQQYAQQQAVQQLATRIQGAEAVFAKQAPDYGDAIKLLDSMRVQELMVFGATPEQAHEQAVNERIQAAFTWAHQGMNPAEIAYNLAKTRGYAPKGAQTAEQKIAAQQKGTAAAKSLGGGGTPNAGKLTAEALASMSDEDFAKLTDAQFRQAMGG
jgi:DNA repair exonuclease SbcCD ATPase subunit